MAERNGQRNAYHRFPISSVAGRLAPGTRESSLRALTRPQRTTRCTDAALGTGCDRIPYGISESLRNVGCLGQSIRSKADATTLFSVDYNGSKSFAYGTCLARRIRVRALARREAPGGEAHVSERAYPSTGKRTAGARGGLALLALVSAGHRGLYVFGTVYFVRELCFFVGLTVVLVFMGVNLVVLGFLVKRTGVAILRFVRKAKPATAHEGQCPTSGGSARWI